MNLKIVAKVTLGWSKQQAYILTHPANILSLISAKNECDGVITVWTPNRSKDMRAPALWVYHRFTSVITTLTITHSGPSLSIISSPDSRKAFFLHDFSKGSKVSEQCFPCFFSSIDVTRVGWYQLLDPSSKLHSNAIKYNQHQSGRSLPHSLAEWPADSLSLLNVTDGIGPREKSPGSDLCGESVLWSHRLPCDRPKSFQIAQQVDSDFQGHM